MNGKWLTGIALLTALGCQAKSEGPPVAGAGSAGSSPSTAVAAAATPAALAAPLPIAEKPAPASISGGGLHDLAGWLQNQPNARSIGRMPTVVLSEQHRQLSIIRVGDRFPSLPLQTLDGQPTTLSAHVGPRGTIVVCWNERQPMSVEQIERMKREMVDRYHDAGMQVVTIAVRSDLDRVRQRLDAAGLSSQSVNLIDADGTAFEQVARGQFPRTYLLDATGSVLWFDLEYSRGTRQSLEQAALFYLQQLPK